MTRDKFDTEIKRLHLAFGAYPYGGKGDLADAAMRRYVDKIAEWFGLWQRFYRETADVVLTKMVDQSITEFDRTPSFAQFRGLRESALRTLPRQGYATTNCNQCNNDGVIWAWMDVLGYGPASCAFRCDQCMNWQGKYDGLPIWSGESKFEIAPKMCFDPSDRLQIKGIALLRTAAPKLYAKIIAKHPEMVEAAIQLEVGEIIKTVPGEQRDSWDKEQVKARSLRQDEMEEAPF